MHAAQFLARNNFYVMIDDHSEDATVQTNPGGWPQMWASLVKDIVADSYTSTRVFVDLLNEPDHASFNWGSVGPYRIQCYQVFDKYGQGHVFGHDDSRNLE